MKILIISYEFPPLVGGAGTYARELAVGLSRLDCKVEIITCYHGNKENNKKSDSELLEKNRITVTRYKAIGKLFFLQLHRTLIKKYTEEYHKKFDFLILADGRASRYAILYMNDEQLSRSAHIFHGGEIDNFFLKPNFRVKMSGIRSKFISTLLKSRANITVSKDFKSLFLKEIPKLNGKIHYVLHGIDDSIFKPIDEKSKLNIRNQYDLGKNHLIILTASRLVKPKGQDNLIQAYASLVQKFPDTKLVIAGDGDYKNELEKLSVKLNITNHIVFTGELSRENLAKLMAASNLFVMTSRRKDETFGLVYIEANACGLPVLAGNISGVKEAVEDGVSGLLVDPYDLDDIRNKLESILYQNILKDLGIKAYNRFKEGFTCKHMAEKTLKILNK